ncbi:MAG: sigma-70 family RNA polymerase sigma factor [Acidobacteria bacterium]|nr:sigma-70 family RNA polymerase sigma factor [Acidobacteriota bacterium]
MPALVAVGPLMSEITTLLEGWRRGDKEASDQVLALVYTDLRRLARRELGRRGRQGTLQPTALVHEAYLRLAGPSERPWKNRGHFFSVAAQAMRQIVVDHARRRQADKRGGNQVGMSLTGVEAQASERPETIVALDEALTLLAERDSRLVRIIEYRVFGGLETRQIADLLELSPRSIQLDWLRARAWIGQALALDAQDETSP